MTFDSVAGSHVPRSADCQLTNEFLLPEWAEADRKAVDSVTEPPVPGPHDQLIVSWLMSSSYLSELKLIGRPLILLPDPLYQGLYPWSADYQLTDKLLLPKWAETDGMAVDPVARSPISRIHVQSNSTKQQKVSV
jgi:hypothetical protein